LTLDGIAEVLIITTPVDQPAFERLHGWGARVAVAMRHLFHGHDLFEQLRSSNGQRAGATV